MNTIAEDAAFWRQHIEQLKLSGLSRAQYCRDNGLSYAQCSYWLKRVSRSTSDAFIPVQLKPSQDSMISTPLCVLESRVGLLKILDLSALSFILDRME